MQERKTGKMMGSTLRILAVVFGLFFFCSGGMASAGGAGSQPASPQTRAANSHLPEELSDDSGEDELARRGLIAAAPELVIRDANGKIVWDMQSYTFLVSGGPAPDTVNPALWRHARRNVPAGLFKVTDGVYQVRGYDISNITFIEGKTGIIVVDPLVSAETAKAALDLFYRHTSRRPVVAVIYTHSHVDHFGGVEGVTSEAEVIAGKVRILAPAGMTEAVISENLLAGNAMNRRATYMFGTTLPRGPAGQVDAGIGKAASTGTISYLLPTEELSPPVAEKTIDGVRFVFQQVPQTEAPAEMNFYLPDHQALCIAENTTASLHNLLTPRGAQVRDARAWYRSIDESLDLFGDRTDVLLMTHLWPRFGKAASQAYLKKQRDLYKYIHDQTVRRMNQGYTMDECAEMIRLPESLAGLWYNRDFYGTVSFNVKAVYQRYLGWFDGNPAHLHRLPPEEAGRRYVEFMGGSQAVLDKARQSVQKGEYRWAAEVLNHLVFAEPQNRAARELQADVLEQLGYRAESPIWRNFYLTGARELRWGVLKDAPRQAGRGGALRAMPLETFFELMAVRLDAAKAADKKIAINWELADTGERYVVTLENSVLYYKRGRDENADATVSLSRPVLDAVIAKQATFSGRILAGDITVQGHLLKFLSLMSCLDNYEFWFNIVTP